MKWSLLNVLWKEMNLFIVLHVGRKEKEKINKIWCTEGVCDEKTNSFELVFYYFFKRMLYVYGK